MFLYEQQSLPMNESELIQKADDLIKRIEIELEKDDESKRERLLYLKDEIEKTKISIFSDQINISILGTTINKFEKECDDAFKTIYVYNKGGIKGASRTKQISAQQFCSICNTPLEDRGSEKYCATCNVLTKTMYSEPKQQGQAEDPYVKCIKYCAFLSGTHKINKEIYAFGNKLIQYLFDKAQERIILYESQRRSERLQYFARNHIKDIKPEINRYYLSTYPNEFKIVNSILLPETLAKHGVVIEYRKNEQIDLQENVRKIPIITINDLREFREACKDVHKSLDPEETANFTPQHYPFLQTLYRIIYEPINMPIISPEDAHIISERYVEFDKLYVEQSSKSSSEEQRVNRRKISEVIKNIISNDQDLARKYKYLPIIGTTMQTTNANELTFVNCRSN